MTAQMGDNFYYGRHRYALIAATSYWGFSPEEHGIETTSPHTANYRGFVADYSIGAKGLLFQRLELYTPGSADIVSIYGKEPYSVVMHNEGEPYAMRELRYKGIGHRLDFDGKLVLGRDFLHEYYIHAGFQHAWAYRYVYEFIFSHGQLQEIKDHSDKLREIRENTDDPVRLLWGHSNWALDMESKAWWLDKGS